MSHRCKDNLVFLDKHYFQCSICHRIYWKWNNKLTRVAKYRYFPNVDNIIIDTQLPQTIDKRFKFEFNYKISDL